MKPQDPGRRAPPSMHGVARVAFNLSTLRTDGRIKRAAATGRHDDDAPVLDLDDPEQRSFGDFELIERIGEGGMGSVYHARQASLDRDVALKLLSAGPWASDDFIAMFKYEAQSAARLHHPNIVGVYAIGEQEGLIYYAMELVRGETLDRCLDREHALSPKDAAVLTRTIAEAVDYAHRLGVLHLDLKPSNILLDRAGTPKIADFGLARRLGRGLSVENQHVLGTPSYMAPEQTDAQHGVLTPATDVWGLGTILYECVAGSPPFLAPTAAETLRLVREGRVRKLSRSADVHRDLEAICAKCLARSPQQRYVTARALADDLGRYLEGRPVRARPLNVWQRFGHWMRRDPALAFAVAGAGVALVAGIAATSLQWRRAERNATAAREVNRFINDDLLAIADPYRVDRDMAGLLTRAEARLDASFADQPAARAQIGLSIGRAWLGQGHWQAARTRLERTYLDARNALGPTHPQTLEAAEYLALALTSDAQYQRAEEVYRTLLPTLEQQAGRTSARTLRVRRAHAMMLYETDQFEPALRELQAVRNDSMQAPEALAEIDTTLAELYTETNRWDEAMAALENALLRSRQQLGANHPEYLWRLVSLGDMLMMRGDWEEADALFAHVHEGLVETIGDSHPRTLTAVHYLGLVRLERGEPAKALPLLQQALRERIRVQGADHKWTHYSMNRVAEAYVELDRPDAAIPLLRQALESVDRTGRRRQAYVILLLDTMGRAYLRKQEPAQAEPYLREGLELARSTLPGNNVRRGIIERSMGQLRAQQGRYAEARAHYAVAERIFDEGWGPRHPWVRDVRARMAKLPAHDRGDGAKRVADARPDDDRAARGKHPGMTR
ncbi:serine/threonine-protein kinase [Lysobacter solisilvae (ex Woo and Kim 2020)]|uniref:Serine/threonine protein kinase n=1 Tax=Agrilutibacter terrestris TaxID=2865112 RepID=A0A7H0FUV6_9GAMM|nr:serine/threonine-protein kinase [Lysobacter terrestris]QNP39822.1 serine/threonine protein kinase [Lysobacter terrestris]